MWDLYFKRDAGVAIITTARKLEELASEHTDRFAIFAAVSI